MLAKVLIVILVILVILLVVLYFLGKKMQKKQAEQEAQIEAAKQTVTMLIIDKKKAKAKRCRTSRSCIGANTQIYAPRQIPYRKSQGRSANHVSYL